MSKLSLDNSVKFKRLIYGSKIPKPYIRGLLDTLWNSAHTNGNPIIGTADDVEIASEWPGERGQWFAMLRDGKWIEQVGEDQWRLWHYFDHCPDYVVKRIARSKGVEYKGFREILMAEFRNPTESTGKKRKPSESVGRQRKPTQTRPDQTSPDQAKQDKQSPQEGLPEATAKPAASSPPPALEPARPAAPRKPASGPHAEFIAAYCDAWKAHYGDAYPFADAKDGAHVKWIRGQLADDVARWRRVVARYLDDADPFHHGHTLGNLRAQFAKWLTDKPPPRKPGEKSTNAFMEGLAAFAAGGDPTVEKAMDTEAIRCQ